MDNAQRQSEPSSLNEEREQKRAQNRAKKEESGIASPYKIWKSICLYCHCIQRKMEFTNHLNEIMMTSLRIYGQSGS